MKAYLAIDIGASSGRLIAGFIENGYLKMQEIYRFTNGMSEIDDHLGWDVEHLFNEIIAALKTASKLGLDIQSLGIDTWGVDYMLINADGSLTDKSYAYRDDRTQGMDEVFYKEVMPLKELYARNGIQKLIFNTVYQLTAHIKQNPQAVQSAASLLMMPDYLNYLLTGEAKNEYTNATTSQLVNVETKDWDYELIERMGLPTRLFKTVCLPGTLCGRLKPEIAEQVGFNCDVVMVGSHDTASAVAAAPLLNFSHIFLSSGTWSLMGVEQMEANCSDESFNHNFTNEGGYDYRYRFLKNIMGSWILQNLRKELPPMSFEEQYALAEQGSDFKTIVDVNDQLFLNPKSMKQAFIDYCHQHNLTAPANNAELLYCAYRSLAECYKKVVQELEEINHKTYEAINIFGGGCQDKFLNKLIAKTTGKKILTGPIEATALGNICVQMIKYGEVANLMESRELIIKSFDISQVQI